MPENFVVEPLCAVFQKNSGSKKIYEKEVGWGHQDFLSKVFCLLVPKNFIGEPFSVSLISVTEKLYASEGYVTNFRRKIFVSQYQNISKRNRSVLCFSKFPVAKCFWIRRGSIKVLRGNFVVSQCQKTSLVNRLVCH